MSVLGCQHENTQARPRWKTGYGRGSESTVGGPKFMSWLRDKRCVICGLSNINYLHVTNDSCIQAINLSSITRRHHLLWNELATSYDGRFDIRRSIWYIVLGPGRDFQLFARNSYIPHAIKIHNKSSFQHVKHFFLIVGVPAV